MLHGAAPLEAVFAVLAVVTAPASFLSAGRATRIDLLVRPPLYRFRSTAASV